MTYSPSSLSLILDTVRTPTSEMATLVSLRSRGWSSLDQLMFALGIPKSTMGVIVRFPTASIVLDSTETEGCSPVSKHKLSKT